MAAGDISRDTRTALANISNFHGKANGYAVTFGEVNGGAYRDCEIHLKFSLGSGSDGSFDLYLVESQDGAEWTDDIDPTADTASDQAAKLATAPRIASLSAVYSASRTTCEAHVSVPRTGRPQYFGFVLVNNCGQASESSGADGDSVLQNIAAS